MEQTVITVCNYVDAIDNYCSTYDTDRVCYAAAYVTKISLHMCCRLYTKYYKCKYTDISYLKLSVSRLYLSVLHVYCTP